MTDKDPGDVGDEIEFRADETGVDSQSSTNSPRDLQGIVIPLGTLTSFLIDAAKRRSPRKSKRWARPFYVDEQLLTIFDRRLQESMVNVIEPNTLSRNILVYYSDLSSESYTTLDEFFSLSTEEYDAESVQITWSGFGIVDGDYHEATLLLETEKPLENSVFRTPVPEAAGIEISVLGPTRNWVRQTFNSLSAVITNTRLPILFRPLERLRDPIYTQVGGYILGGLAWYVVFQWASSTLQGPSNESIRNKILSHHTLGEQFAEYVRQIYSNSGSPFIIGFLVFLLPWLAFFVVQLLGKKYLPYLVPRSAINVGLAGRRYKEYMNLFRFLGFTVVVGIILAVIANAITTLLGI